ncbi:MAG: hypothetical protein IPJ65_41115 [Archangiaceae bacterium]|nr:hypothetical protein [Archangiaceae bacterium]
MRHFTCLLAVFGALAACSPPMGPLDAGGQPGDSGLPDAGAPADAGESVDAGATPPTLGWRKVDEAPPSRSTHVAFYWPPAKSVLVFSGNHVTGPIHDAWAWDGRGWQSRPLATDEYPERKNPGVAVDAAGGRVFVFGGTWSGYTSTGQYLVRVMNDLQVFDGTGWKKVDAAGAPAARGGDAAVYDAARGKLMVFGGSDSGVAFDDTWTFDGTTWAQVATGTAAHPSARVNARMAYDPERQRVVLFSGQGIGAGGAPVNLDDTWEWDGTAWHEMTGLTPRPEGRGMHVLQWDPLRHKVMLVGGARHFPPLPSGSAFADQWEWDGTQWAQLRPPGALPPARTATTLAFAADRNVMVMYGGFDEVDLADVWEWDGQQWAERTTLPVPRSDFAFAQPRAAEGLLFGGYFAGGGSYAGDTWRFKDGGWRRVTGVAPPPRSAAVLAFHGDDAVLFGGMGKQGSSNVLRGDMWTLKAGESDWRQVTSGLPPARRSAAMGYDPERGLTVLFGGRGVSAGMADTWVWDGTSWAAVATAVAPPARWAARLVFDPKRRQLVLAGGQLDDRSLPNDTWAFDGTKWSKLEGLTAAPVARIFGGTVFDAFGRLLAWGGYDGTNLYGDVGVREGASWAQVDSGPSPRLDGALIDLGGTWRTLFGAETDFTSRWEDRADTWELAPTPGG